MFHTFTYKLDEDMGALGWVCDAKPYFDPMGGQGVAHDILEEMPHGGEQPHDEAMALGAMLFGRGSMSNAFGRHPIEKVLANEFGSLYSHAFNEDHYYLVEAPETQRLDKGYHGDSFEREEAIIQATAPLVLEYIDKYGDDEWGDNPDNIALAKSWIPHAQNWLRIGFRRARRRFWPHWDGCDVAMMFERIRDEVQAINAREGDKLTVRLMYRRHNLLVWHKPLEAYW